MDKTEQLNSWTAAVHALYVASVVLDRAGQGLADSDILGAALTREQRARLAVWLEEIDAWAQTDTRRVTLPALLLGANLLEFEQIEEQMKELRAATIEEVMAEAERHLRGGDPCTPTS